MMVVEATQSRAFTALGLFEFGHALILQFLTRPWQSRTPIELTFVMRAQLRGLKKTGELKDVAIRSCYGLAAM
jgi:hypothetical protein